MFSSVTCIGTEGRYCVSASRDGSGGNERRYSGGERVNIPKKDFVFTYVLYRIYEALEKQMT
jgi:hypothetical protein